MKLLFELVMDLWRKSKIPTDCDSTPVCPLERRFELVY